jgi:hypothetical protein
MSPLCVGLSARVVIHDAETHVMRRDAIHIEAWKAAAAAAAAMREATVRIASRRRGPGPPECGA